MPIEIQTSTMYDIQTQPPSDDDSKISWIVHDEEEDTNTSMDIQSNEDDDDDIYTSTEVDICRPQKVNKTSKKSSLEKHKKTKSRLSKRKK